MLFNSYVFIFLFLPIALAGFFLASRWKGHRTVVLVWLTLTSLFFYGWWNPIYVLLILASIAINYAIGFMMNTPGGFQLGPLHIGRKVALVVGISANLFALAYFKYAYFILQNVSGLIGHEIPFERIVLPLAISFFTFQQIGYLVDAYRQDTSEYSFAEYCVFVTFFPQLIAGPIVHHKEMLPQFAHPDIGRPNTRHLAVGVTVFFIGLFKKVVLADGAAVYASPVFAAAEAGQALSFVDSWLAGLAYTFQLYFDFSGYSDMAIGLGRMFNIKLPINFYSPYKAHCIIDFWRRWHITLSSFLRDYFYIPMGGSRRGLPRRYLNLMLTTVLCGVWHGAGWNYVAFGFLHGSYVILNHAFRVVRRHYGQDPESATRLGRGVSHVVTFVAVTFGMVLFRADSIGAAFEFFRPMIGLNGVALPAELLPGLGTLGGALADLGVRFEDAPFVSFEGLFWVTALGLIAFCLPNTMQLVRDELPCLYGHSIQIEAPRLDLKWSPNLRWQLYLGLVITLSVIFVNGRSVFLYFQF